MDLEKQILQNFPNWQDFVEEQKPEQLVINYDFVNNFYDVYETSPITLFLLTKIYPRKEGSAGYEYLKSWLQFLNKFLNINKGLKSDGIELLSYMLYQRYNHFHLSDLKLILTHILESRYGTFYGSIDTQRMMSSFFEYNREREETFTKIREREAIAKEKAEKKRPYSPPDPSKIEGIRQTMASPDTFISTLARKKSV